MAARLPVCHPHICVSGVSYVGVTTESFLQVAGNFQKGIVVSTPKVLRINGQLALAYRSKIVAVTNMAVQSNRQITRHMSQDIKCRIDKHGI